MLNICTRDKNATQPAFFTLSTKTIRDNAGVPNHQTGRPGQNEKGVIVLLLPFLLQLFAEIVDDLRQFVRVLHHRQMPGVYLGDVFRLKVFGHFLLGFI